MAQAFSHQEEQNQESSFSSKEFARLQFEQDNTTPIIDARTFCELRAARHEKIGRNLIQAFTSNKPIDNL